MSCYVTPWAFGHDFPSVCKNLSQWFSTRGNFALLGDSWQCLETFLVVITWGGMLLSSSGEGLGMHEHLPTAKNCLAWMSVVPMLRNLAPPQHFQQDKLFSNRERRTFSPLANCPWPFFSSSWWSAPPLCYAIVLWVYLYYRCTGHLLL